VSTTEKNKAIGRRFYEEVRSRGDLGVLDEIMADDYRHHEPALPEARRGRAAYREVIAGLRAALPDYTVTVERAIAERDVVAALVALTETNTGSLGGRPATGRRVAMSAVDVFGITDGKSAERWLGFDSLVFLRQLGLIPTPAQA
jgi:steroid delta-isomerase-like uncharacterized protein